MYTLSTILKFVVASAAEAELGALFHNVKEARVLRLALQELGQPQPPTTIPPQKDKDGNVIAVTSKDKAELLHKRFDQ